MQPNPASQTCCSAPTYSDMLLTYTALQILETPSDDNKNIKNDSMSGSAVPTMA